ncbi:MAG: thioredoxin family protein [Verrucomicrobia bacterium]|nr:thioredoxin family protein [Verrucomicrobiota bacterium]
MKALAFLLTLAFISSPLLAAEDTWLTDLPKALEQAKAQKKMVLIDFTGSDWCPPCKSLHKTVLTSVEFSKFAKDNLVLVELDFPKSKPQTPELKAANQELSKKYAIRGYPTVIVLDADGKELFKKVGYGGTPAAEYVAELAKLKK